MRHLVSHCRSVAVSASAGTYIGVMCEGGSGDDADAVVGR